MTDDQQPLLKAPVQVPRESRGPLDSMDYLNDRFKEAQDRLVANVSGVMMGTPDSEEARPIPAPPHRLGAQIQAYEELLDRLVRIIDTIEL